MYPNVDLYPNLRKYIAEFIKEKIVVPMMKKEGYADDIIDSIEVKYD